MKYRVFNTEAEAIAAEAQVALDIGCAKVGVNAKTGQPEPDKQVTERWAIPQQILDGRWVFPSSNEEGIESEESWWPQDDFF
jgi:hypothetical protein